MRSLVTFAITEAAAIDRLRPSPFTIARCTICMSGSVTASINRQSGLLDKPSIARRIAFCVAGRIPTASISAASASPTETSRAVSAISLKSRSRRSGKRHFESLRPGNSFWRGRTTAAATTGPARGPRPASSTPAIHENPLVYASASKNPSGSTPANGITHSSLFASSVELATDTSGSLNVSRDSNRSALTVDFPSRRNSRSLTFASLPLLYRR